MNIRSSHSSRCHFFYEIIEGMKILNISKLYYTPRKHNRVTHSIANFANGIVGPVVWESSPPIWLQRLLDAYLVDCSPVGHVVR